jgi:hypothetical protein
LIYAPLVNGDVESPLQGRVFDIRGRSADLLLGFAAAMDFKKTLTTCAQYDSLLWGAGRFSQALGMTPPSFFLRRQCVAAAAPATPMVNTKVSERTGNVYENKRPA